MAKARQLEEEAKAFDEKSEALMHQHHRWAEATTLLQVSIALAAIALLTRRRCARWGTLGVAAVGIATGVAAFMNYYQARGGQGLHRRSRPGPPPGGRRAYRALELALLRARARRLTGKSAPGRASACRRCRGC